MQDRSGSSGIIQICRIRNVVSRWSYNQKTSKEKERLASKLDVINQM